MNKNLFDSMQEQMNPRPEVRAALSKKLTRPAKRRIPIRKYAAIAACAVLVVGSFPVYSLCQDQEKWLLIIRSFNRNAEVPHLHSYVLMDGPNIKFTTSGEDTTAELNGEEGADRDMGMTPQDLEQAMLEVGYTPEEIEEYQSIGYQMTWAKWWKFVDGQKNSEVSEPFNLADLKTFSQKELYVNTDAPSVTEAAPVPGGGAQNDLFSISQDEAIRLYDILCSHLRSRYGQQENFSPNWPEWYGGGYLNNDRPDRVARLTLVLVKDYDTPALRQEIYDFLGSDHVDFQSGKYALSYLHDLHSRLRDYPVIWGSFASCGTDEENNRLYLNLTDVTDEALMVLAELDPDDDAIYVQTGQRITLDVAVDDMGEDLAVMPGGAFVPDEDPLTAVTYDVETGEITYQPYPYSEESEMNGSRSTAPFNPGR